jgi:hypothetical protein
MFYLSLNNNLQLTDLIVTKIIIPKAEINSSFFMDSFNLNGPSHSSQNGLAYYKLFFIGLISDVSPPLP